jgi:hypothetical protein
MTRTRLFIAVTLALGSAAAANAADVGPVIGYVPNSLVQSVIRKGPWTLHEHEHAAAAAAFNHDASGIVPTAAAPPDGGSGFPYAGFCTVSGELATNHGTSVMQPYYFPFVRRHGDVLEGYFDYRPRNEQEATVGAISSDWGASWSFRGMALALNPYCPWDSSDPDNLNVSVAGAETPYGSSSANAADNGLGHPVALTINGVTRIYSLNRANGHIDSDQLVVHTVSGDDSLLGSLPAYGFVSPLASGGYPSLDASAQSTTGLQNPDAIMGSVRTRAATVVLYVEKTLNADTTLGYPACPVTPGFALTNLVNHKARKANHDVTTVRVASTTDGVNFTDVGAVSGLFDPTSVALNGIRYLGSGSILPLADGRYGMFFGAGNCLDNDSDGFHFIGYAETDARVKSPADLLAWHVVNGFDNPILSTDTVIDPASGRQYPANMPIVNVLGADALTLSEIAPFVPVTGGYNSNFFSGRVYDPQAIYTDSKVVTIVFAGYNTPQPSNNLGDYRSIGRFQVQFPAGYVAPF